MQLFLLRLVGIFFYDHVFRRRSSSVHVGLSEVLLCSLNPKFSTVSEHPFHRAARFVVGSAALRSFRFVFPCPFWTELLIQLQRGSLTLRRLHTNSCAGASPQVESPCSLSASFPRLTLVCTLLLRNGTFPTQFYRDFNFLVRKKKAPIRRLTHSSTG